MSFIPRPNILRQARKMPKSHAQDLALDGTVEIWNQIALAEARKPEPLPQERTMRLTYIRNSHFTDPLFEQTRTEYEIGQSNIIIDSTLQY
jgi:hypothetical protein